MIAPAHRTWRVCLLVVMASRLAGGVAAAQTSDQQSFARPTDAVKRAGVPIGDVVYVTDMTGATIRGRLTALDRDAVQVKIGTDVRSVTAAEVQRIQWQQRDSPLTGVLIGAAVGAIPGIYWLVADPNECRGMCPEEYALIAIGAVVGGLIDHAIKRKVTVYSVKPPGGGAPSFVIGPLVARDRKGLQVAVTF